jgi:hypothetical protein
MPDFGLTYMHVCLFGYRAATATETPPSLDLLGQWRMKRLTGRLAHGCWDCVHLVPSELRVTTLSSSSKRSTKLHVAGACRRLQPSPGHFACILGMLRLSVSATPNAERSARSLRLSQRRMWPPPPHHDAAWAIGGHLDLTELPLVLSGLSDSGSPKMGHGDPRCREAWHCQ